MATMKDIEAVIGKDNADRLIMKFGGEKVYIPKKGTMTFKNADDRNEYIFGLCKKHNMKYDVVGEIVGLSEDRIRHIAADVIRNRKKVHDG